MAKLATRRDFLAASAVLVAGQAAPVPARANPRPTVAAPIRVVVWDERQPAQKEAYDDFLGNQIAAHLRKEPGVLVKSVGLDDPGQGVTDAVLGDAQVLIWWGHVRHGEVKPEVGVKIAARIKAGTLSLIALHSAHWSTHHASRVDSDPRQFAAAKSDQESQ